MISSGDTYKSIGKVLLVLGVIGALALKFAKDDMEEFKWVFILGAPLVLGIGASLLFRGKQVKTKELSKVVFDDSSDKVLYLRAFGSQVLLYGVSDILARRRGTDEN